MTGRSGVYRIWFLAILFLLIGHQRAIGRDFLRTETYLIGSKNILCDSLFSDSLFSGYVMYQLDDVFIARGAPMHFRNLSANFTQTCPLEEPIDSLMALYFKSTRRLKRAAFVFEFRDIYDLRRALPFDFRVNASPLKEINIFIVNNLSANEFYFDVDLQKVRVDSQMGAFLFFEYLWQVFLNQKILKDKLYTESVLVSLAAPERPIYAPELHFFLEAKAADEVVSQWTAIKKAFRNRVIKRSLDKEYEAFEAKLKLITETPQSGLVLFAKLMGRYGCHQKLKAVFENKETFLRDFQNKLPEFIRGMRLIWFRPSEIDQNLVKALRKQKLEGGVRLFIQ